MSDRLNPIFVYEIRQLVRNRSILGLLCIYLVLLVVGIGYVLLEMSGHADGSQQGRNLTAFILITLYLFTFTVSVAHSAGAARYQSLEDELVHRTTLGWYRTFLGKIQVSAGLGLLFYTATLPFLTLAWTLRGVDLFCLAGVVTILFLTTQLVAGFVAAAFIRCRNGYDIAGAVIGMLVAMPPLFYLIVIPPFAGIGLLFAPNMDASSTMTALAFGLIVLETLGFGFIFTRMIFESNWKLDSAAQRFCNVAFVPWIAAPVVIGVGVFIGSILLR